MMTNEEIKNFINNLRGKVYQTGVMYAFRPEWAKDLYKCIQIIDQLLEKETNVKHE